MSKFDFYLNRTGPRGPQGIQGEQGFSPIITVATNTLSEYVLQIQTQNNTFLTANLREHKDDLGGTYIRYNRETGVMFAGDADVASQSQMGVVRFATATDIEREDDSSVVSPADVADMIANIDPSGDISALESRVTEVEGDIVELEDVTTRQGNAITELQSNVSGLLTNYVPKTRTINGYALSSNITLTASDVNAYSKSETDTLLADKADVSDLPDMNNYYNTTQIDLMLNDKADISDIPTVGNGTITFTQGGVTKGTITTNQSGDTTIALDAGGGGGTTYTEGTGIDITSDVISVDFTDVATASQGTKADTAVQPSDLATVATTGDYTDLLNKPSPYTLPAATTSTLGGVIVDGTTITVDSNGVITSVGGGGGGTTYNPGNGIDINSSTSTIAAKPDGTTIDFNTSGELKVISAPTPSNMVTTDTTQTVTGAKTFSETITVTNDSYSVGVNTGYNNVSYPILAVSPSSTTGRTVSIGNATFPTSIDGSSITLSGTPIINRSNTNYTNIDSGNISSYALTSLPVATTSALGGVIPDGTTITVDANGTIHGASTYVLPTASTSTLGGVKVDGTTITIDGNGVISSSGGGSSYTAGTGIDITNDVISVDNTVVASKDDLDEKQDVFESVAPLNLTQAINVGKAYTSSTETEFTSDTVSSEITLCGVASGSISGFDATKPYKITIENLSIGSSAFQYNQYPLQLRPSNGSVRIQFAAAGGIYLIGNLSNSTITSIISEYTLGNNYDIEIEYNGTGTFTGRARIHGAQSWASQQYLYQVLQTPENNYVKVGSNSFTCDIHDIEFIANGNVLFERSDSQLSLSIGSGLAVQNGSLVNTNPTAPTVMTGADGTNAGTSGLVPAPSATDNTKYLRGDGTFATPQDTTYSVMTGATSSTAGASGLVPAPAAGDDTKFLSGDGTFKTVPTVTVDQTYNASSTNAQSGTAVAGAIADKVDSSDLVDISEAYPTLMEICSPDYSSALALSSGSFPYTAPSAGLVYIDAPANNAAFNMTVNGVTMANLQGASSYYSRSGWVRVAAGDVIAYTASGFDSAKFIPLKGV